MILDNETQRGVILACIDATIHNTKWSAAPQDRETFLRICRVRDEVEHADIKQEAPCPS